MRSLVTGAGGQVGQDLIADLLQHGDDVLGTDIAPRPSSRLLAEAGWQRLDVTDKPAVDAVVGGFRPDRVFHLAAILSARGEHDPQRTYEINQNGTVLMLEACMRFGTPQLMFASTIAVFGGQLPEVVDDDHVRQPTTMYGVTKVGGELLGDYYRNRYGLDFRAVRFPGLISASLPGGGTSDYALFMYIDGMRNGKYNAFCRPDTRIPFMYMPDGIRALVELSNASREGLTRSVYNIAAFSPTAQEIADSVTRALPDCRIGFEPDPERQGILDSWPSVLDDRCARKDWGWTHAYDLDRMTEDLIPRLRNLFRNDPAFASSES